MPTVNDLTPESTDPQPDENLETPAEQEPVADATPAEVEAPETPEIAEETSEPAEPVADDAAWRQPFEQAGFVDVNDQDEATERLLEAYQQQQARLDELAEQNRLYRQFSDYRAPEQQHTAEPEPAEPESLDPIEGLTSRWPDIPSHLLQKYWVQRQNPDTGVDESGWSPDTPQEVRGMVAELERVQADWHNTLADPRQFAKAIDARVQRMIEQNFEQGWQQRETMSAEQAAVQQFEQNNDWIYEKDPVTKARAVDIQGNPVLSKDGEVFVRFINDAANMGITRASDRLRHAELAFSNYKHNVTQQPAVARENAASVAQEKRDAMVGKKRPTNTGRTAVNGVSPDQHTDSSQANQGNPGARAVAALREDGFFDT